MKRNFTHPKLRQHLTEALAVLLFLGLIVPAAQARRQNDQRAVGVRPTDLVNTLPEKSKRYALIIGVDKYADSSISPLDGASNDAKALADALIRHAGFPADQVILLATDQPPQRQPTREEILLRLSNLRSAVPKDGLLLVAFAGHGIERNNQAYLLPSNARIHGDIELLQDTSISVTRMKEAIRAVGVGQVVLFLDACRNDPASGRSDSVNPLTNTYTRAFNFDVRNREVTAFATLYATEVGRRAYEYKEKRQGYFTWALVEGLQGAAANERGEVTLSRLIRHVQEAVPKRVLLDLGRNVSQKPFAQVEGYRADELVIAVAERRAPISSPDAEIAYWNSIKDSGNPANFRAYLEDFPQGRFRRLAENRLRELEEARNRLPVVDPAPKTSARMSVAGVALALLSPFTTVTLDASGKIVDRRPNQESWGYVEDLGAGVKLEMVEIPAGEFLMGEDAAGAADYEKECARYVNKDSCASVAKMQTPQRRVKLNGFLMGKYEVTQRQWSAVMGGLPPDMASLGNEFKGDDLPVVNVSWKEAQEFIRKLNEKLKLSRSVYSLPSEAEWEYAARAGTRTPYAFGETISPETANYAWDYPHRNTPKKDGLGHPEKVGSYPANAFGLFDMHGNVWEWCEDDWHDNYSNASTDGRAWVDSPSRGSARVVRGGGWANYAVGCRSAVRFGYAPGARYYYLGFRLLRTYR